MNEEIKKISTVKKGNNGNQKNVCKICGKKIFDKDMQTTMCIKTRYGGEICLNCAYEIEETLSRAEFSGMMDYDDFFDMNDDSEINFTKTKAKSIKISDSYEDKIIKDLPNKSLVIQKLKKCIIGQDYAIEKVTGIVYRNILSNNKRLKSIPLLIGKSGQGKTEIITELCKLINLPYVVENSKDFTEAGYAGRNPSDIFEDLYEVCGKDINLTNHGVIVIDEFDKLRETNGSERDVSGSGVVNTFLSYLSGVKVPIKDKYNTLIDYVDTTNIIFIFMGAFEDANQTLSLYKIREKRLGFDRKIGFGDISAKDQNKNVDRAFISEDLMNYGFSRQFVGRVSMIELNELTCDDYMKILLNSEISIYRAYKDEFLSHGLTLVCSKKLKENIVKKAMQKKIGARGLKVVCEETFLTSLEHVEDLENHKYTKIIFGNNATESPLDYKLK